jgi:hypothetical protein
MGVAGKSAADFAASMRALKFGSAESGLGLTQLKQMQLTLGEFNITQMNRPYAQQLEAPAPGPQLMSMSENATATGDDDEAANRRHILQQGWEALHRRWVRALR